MSRPLACAAFFVLMLASAAWAADQPPAPAGAQPSAPAVAQPALPPDISLMFSPEEAAAIRKALMDRERPSSEQAAAKEGSGAAGGSRHSRTPNIYVSAVVDFGGGDWTVWANGLRITPDHQSPLFQVVAVKGNQVDLVVPGLNDGGRVRLQPYQTWRSSDGNVIEGIVP